jgi:hypothetical protein
MKTVYGWVVFWPKMCTTRVSVDLFFTSKESFKAEWNNTPLAIPGSTADKEQLVPIQVPDDFDDLDYIPDNY